MFLSILSFLCQGQTYFWTLSTGTSFSESSTFLPLRTGARNQELADHIEFLEKYLSSDDNKNAHAAIGKLKIIFKPELVVSRENSLI